MVILLFTIVLIVGRGSLNRNKLRRQISSGRLIAGISSRRAALDTRVVTGLHLLMGVIRVGSVSFEWESKSLAELRTSTRPPRFCRVHTAWALGKSWRQMVTGVARVVGVAGMARVAGATGVAGMRGVVWVFGLGRSHGKRMFRRYNIFFLFTSIHERLTLTITTALLSDTCILSSSAKAVFGAEFGGHGRLVSISEGELKMIVGVCSVILWRDRKHGRVF